MAESARRSRAWVPAGWDSPAPQGCPRTSDITALVPSQGLRLLTSERGGDPLKGPGTLPGKCP